MATLRTIGEVAEALDLPQHVLRFWETRFKEIDPVKRAGGRRFYRPRDIEVVEAIRHLLYREGYTIKGVQRILKEQGVDAVIADVRRRQGGEAPEPATQSPTAPTAPTAPAPPPPPASAARERGPAAAQATLNFPEPEPPSRPAPVNPFRDEPLAPAPLEPDNDEAEEAEDADIESPAPFFPPLAPYKPPMILEQRPEDEAGRRLREALAEIEECKRLLALTRR
jgi:DNA-binding transcriptional MerR regulator